ncbi:MAG TPA: hypothetical protein VF902_02865 [Coriobacteriia bacterium]
MARAVSDHGRVVCVTCCHAYGGRTALVARMGRSIAEQGMPVLLVDADHSEPDLHSHFGFPAAPGLLQLLESRDEAAPDAILEAGTGLRVLPSGLEHPSSEAPQGWAEAIPTIRRLAPEPTVALVVLPPLLTDAAGATGCCGADAAILVVRKGVTGKNDVVLASRLVAETGTPLAGVVVAS